MRWHEVTVSTTEEAIEMITNFIHELGAGGVSIEESGTLNKKRDTSYGQLYDTPLNEIPEGRCMIKGYFAEGNDIERIIADLNQSLLRLRTFDIDTGNPMITVKDVDDADWADEWKKYFKPIRVSPRLTIKPTWESYTPESDAEIIIELDPGMAFGTGTHETTTLCLKALELVIADNDDVIDVGTGSGILAIAAIKLGARHVLALDLDPVAVTIARENSELNGLQKQITVRQSDLLQVLQVLQVLQAEQAETKLLGVTMPVQVVVANILAEIIILFTDDVYKALRPGGTYITSGIIKTKQAEVVNALEASGLTIVEQFTDQDWVAIIARKL